jgi:hypothetical protein
VDGDTRGTGGRVDLHLTRELLTYCEMGIDVRQHAMENRNVSAWPASAAECASTSARAEC